VRDCAKKTSSARLSKKAGAHRGVDRAGMKFPKVTHQVKTAAVSLT